MSGRRILAIAKRLLQQFRRDRRTLALLFVVPLVIISLLAWVIRGGSTHPKVGLVNDDTGPVGQAIATQLLASDKLQVSTISEKDGPGDLKDGTVAAYVVIPSGFTQALQAHKSVSLDVHLEGSQPGVTAAVLAGLSSSLQAAVDGFGGPVPHVNASYLYGGSDLDNLDFFGAAFIGLFVFFVVFVVTSVSFLRERSQGTLERLMATPLRRGEIVTGYMIGFAALALIQCAEVLLFSLYVIHVHNEGNVGLVFLLEALLALVAVNLGVFLSTFARTEFQAVQFIPIVIVPQVLLSGILFPVSTEPTALQWLSNVLPLTYAVDGMRDIMLKGFDLTSGSLQLDMGVVTAYCAAVIIAAAATLRRRVA